MGFLENAEQSIKIHYFIRGCNTKMR